MNIGSRATEHRLVDGWTYGSCLSMLRSVLPILEQVKRHKVDYLDKPSGKPIRKVRLSERDAECIRASLSVSILGEAKVESSLIPRWHLSVRMRIHAGWINIAVYGYDNGRRNIKIFDKSVFFGFRPKLPPNAVH